MARGFACQSDRQCRTERGSGGLSRQLSRPDKEAVGSPGKPLAAPSRRRPHREDLLRKNVLPRRSPAPTDAPAILPQSPVAARASKHHVGAVACSAAGALWVGPTRSPPSIGAERPLVTKSALNPTRKMNVTYRVNINPRSHMSAGRQSNQNPQIAFNPERKIALIPLVSACDQISAPAARRDLAGYCGFAG